MPRAGICLVVRWVRNLSYTSRASMACFRFVLSIAYRMMESVNSFGGWGVSLKRPVLESVSSFVGWGVSLTRPVLETVWSFVGWLSI